ncbi:MAG TPA: CinA family protein, partial [Flavobacteriaceae bacterium]|nr:CinA family protein [Flavobacteriaceae bacterium]
LLGIAESLIKKHNVVSAEVAEAMALSVKNIYHTDFAISTTGIAGPDKGDGDEDVGTVYIGIATPENVFSEKFNFGNHRSAVIKRAANTALELLRKEILKN